jgi:WD40 repeat protein
MGDLDTPPTVLTGHDGGVIDAAFSLDGQTLVSGSSDETVRLWDLSGRSAPIVLSGHEETVFAVAFSPDGQTVVSGSWDDTIRIWVAHSGTLSERVCELVGRNLTLAEWQQFIGDAPYEQTCPDLPPGDGVTL